MCGRAPQVSQAHLAETEHLEREVRRENPAGQEDQAATGDR